MYSMFGFDQFAYAKPGITKVSLDDRTQFAKIYTLIESWMSKHKVIMAGSAVIDALEGKERSPDDFEYVGYHENPLRLCNMLTNEIFRKLESASPEERIVMMSTAIAYEKYEIHVMGRRIVTLTRIRGDSRTILKPPEIEYFGTTKLRMLSPEVYLMMVYQTLMNPVMAGEWDDAVELANRLEKWVEKRKSIITGGKPTSSKIDSGILTKVKDVILKRVVPLGLVLISRPGVMELISADPDETTIALRSAVYTVYQGDITFKTVPMNVFGDTRLTRWSMRVGGREVAYIYNLASYQMVPYMFDGKVNVAGYYVQLYFILVNIYNIRTLIARGILSGNFAKIRIAKFMDRLIDSMKGPDIWKAASMYKYIGTHIDATLSRKMDRLKSKKSFPRYYPEAYQRHHEKLREI